MIHWRSYGSLLCSRVAILFLFLLAQGGPVFSACPPPISGSWYRANDKKVVTFTGSQLRGHVTTINSVDYENYSCWQSSGSKYIFRQEALADGPGGKIKGYFCWQLVPLTSSTALLYELTSIETGPYYKNQRVHSVDKGNPDPSIDDVCSLNPTAQYPTLLYKVSSASASDVDVSTVTKQQCPADVLATYRYVKDGKNCPNSSSQLDFCADRTTARVHAQCNDNILFSAGGNLSCMASFTRDNKLFLLLLNEDSSLTVPSQRFACLELSESNGAGKAYPNDCNATSGAQVLNINRTVSCPVVDDDGGGGTDIGPIVAGVVVALLVIVGVVVLVVLYKKGCIGRKGKVIKPTTEGSPSEPPPRNIRTPSEVALKQNGTAGTTTDTANGAAAKTQTKLPPIQNSGATTTPATGTPVVPTSTKLPPITAVGGVPSSST